MAGKTGIVDARFSMHVVICPTGGQLNRLFQRRSEFGILFAIST